MKRKFVVMLLCLSMVMAALLTGCQSTGKGGKDENNGGKSEDKSVQESSDQQEEVVLRIYAQYSDDDTKLPFDYARDELKKEMPWVTLELDIQAQDDGQKLKTYAATGDMPDIFNCGYDLINTFIKSGNIIELNDYADQTGYEEVILDNCRDLLYHPDGNIYAFPYAGNEFVLIYYNKELFEQYNVNIPQTFDELLEAAAVFNDNDITPISIFAQEGWVTAAMYDIIATKYIPLGMKGLDTGANDISEEGFLKAAYKLAELVEVNAFAKGATGLNYDQAASLFYNEDAAMFINGQWFVTDADVQMPDKVDWFYFPVTADGGDNRFAMSGAGNIGGFGVSPSTDDVELAAEVAAFMAKKIAEYKYVERANTVVAVKVDKEFNCDITPMIEKLSEEIPNFTSNSTFSWGLGNAKFKTTLEEQTQALIAGTVTPEQFIAYLSDSLQ